MISLPQIIAIVIILAITINDNKFNQNRKRQQLKTGAKMNHSIQIVSTKQPRIFNLSDNVLKVIDKIKSGEIFEVEFTKKNGKYRHMIAKTGVNHNLTGQGSYDPSDYNLIRCFDLEKFGYRQFDFNSIISIRFKNVLYI